MKELLPYVAINRIIRLWMATVFSLDQPVHLDMYILLAEACLEGCPPSILPNSYFSFWEYVHMLQIGRAV